MDPSDERETKDEIAQPVSRQDSQILKESVIKSM